MSLRINDFDVFSPPDREVKPGHRTHAHNDDDDDDDNSSVIYSVHTVSFRSTFVCVRMCMSPVRILFELLCPILTHFACVSVCVCVRRRLMK